MILSAVGPDAVWLPTDIDEKELTEFLANENYCAQTKEDGIHILAARKADDRVVTLNRRGEPHGIPPTLKKVLLQLAPDTMLDGEKLHEGGMVAFDLLYEAGEDLRELPYLDRLTRLINVCLRINSPLLRCVETAIGKNKPDLVERLRNERAEGVIFKDLRSPYTPGRTAWGWTMRRLKFRKSLTAIALRRPANDPDKKASFSLFLFDNGNPVPIGTVTAQQFYDKLEPGQSAIAEVTYLYATPGNKIVQPVLKRPWPFRTDKKAEDCTIDQLIKGGRFAAPQV